MTAKYSMEFHILHATVIVMLSMQCIAIDTHLIRHKRANEDNFNVLLNIYKMNPLKQSNIFQAFSNRILLPRLDRQRHALNLNVNESSEDQATSNVTTHRNENYTMIAVKNELKTHKEKKEIKRNIPEVVIDSDNYNERSNRNPYYRVPGQAYDLDPERHEISNYRIHKNAEDIDQFDLTKASNAFEESFMSEIKYGSYYNIAQNKDLNNIKFLNAEVVIA